MSTDLISQDYDYLFKVLLLGDSDVGKSSLILRYTEETFNSKLVNSIGVDFKMKKKEIYIYQRFSLKKISKIKLVQKQ